MRRDFGQAEPLFEMNCKVSMSNEEVSDLVIDAEAFIPAGGQSRRFGEDKALHEVDGTPLIQRPIDCLRRVFDSVRIIAKEPAVYEGLGVPVLEDLSPKQLPLVGILTGLKASNTSWNFFLACDMPSMTTDVIRRLARSLLMADGNGDPVTAVVPETPSGRQPLAAFYSASGIDSLRTAIEEEWSMKAWLEHVRVRTVHFEDDTPFENVNRKGDLPTTGDRG